MKKKREKPNILSSTMCFSKHQDRLSNQGLPGYVKAELKPTADSPENYSIYFETWFLTCLLPVRRWIQWYLTKLLSVFFRRKFLISQLVVEGETIRNQGGQCCLGQCSVTTGHVCELWYMNESQLCHSLGVWTWKCYLRLSYLLLHKTALPQILHRLVVLYTKGVP